MEVRANTGEACVVYQFEGGVSAWKIEKSVGLGGANRKEDVETIQALLNRIAPEDGGPFPPLKEDGYVGKFTLAAIKKFQQQHHTASDCRVDPDGPTLKKMNEIPKRSMAVENKVRLARAAVSMLDLTQMASKGHRTIENAMNFLRLGKNSLANFQHSYDLAELHFKFGKQPKEVTLSELSFIHTTFQRMRTVLMRRPSISTGGDAFGVSVFTIDPVGKDWVAYTPTDSTENNRKDPTTAGHVYLCRAIDTFSDDKFAHVLAHELFHFVDDESEEHRIGDHGYRDKAMKIPHELRMHNADNFAIFASHVHFGRARLVASFPTLGRHIPANM